MKLPYQQLSQHLSKKTLAPIYVISSDETLLRQEARDQIRESANTAGFAERLRITAEANAEWSTALDAEQHSLSLFCNKRLIELDLTAIKLNQNTVKPLLNYANHIPPDTILLIQTSKLDQRAEQSQWFQALDKKSMTIVIWPISAQQLPQWIMERAKKSGLNLSKTCCELLAIQVEGNLLAAAQEIEKCLLLQDDSPLDEKTLTQAISSDHAHFTVFDLVDSALMGNGERVIRILHNLQSEDVEPVFVLWALTRELRILATLAKEIAAKKTFAQLCSQFRIWEKRQPAVKHFLQHHQETACWQFLKDAARIDRIIKGADKGNAWHALQNLALRIARNAIISL